jgi:hypothetical protein
MATSKIEAGICGFHTQVEAEALENYEVKLKIESTCKHIQKFAEDLKSVNAFNEISHKRGTREILAKGAEYCTHASCPVPVGIIKTVEVAAGLALPQVVKIEVED